MARYTIELTPEFDKLLSDLAKEKHSTKSDVLRKAVAAYQYLNRQVDVETGTKVSITNSDDRVLKDVVLP